MAFSLSFLKVIFFESQCETNELIQHSILITKLLSSQSLQQIAGKNRWAVSRTLRTQQQVSPPKGNSLSCRNCNFRRGTYLPAFSQVGCSQGEKARGTFLHALLLLGCFGWALSSIILTHGKNLGVPQKRKLFQRRISNFRFRQVYWHGKAFLN